MALINCPECCHQISDKAQSCPNCGYPLNEILSVNTKKNSDFATQNYCVVFKRLGQPNKIEIIKEVRKIGNYDLQTAKDIVDFPPSIVIKNISKQVADEVQVRLGTLGAFTSIEKLEVNANKSDSNQEIKKILDNNKDDIIRCPRCGSNAITTGQRGFSIFTGFLGSNKTVNRCGNCGYSWQPK